MSINAGIHRICASSGKDQDKVTKVAKFIKTPVKGMCDMLPSDMRLREHVLAMIKENYGRYGFMQIETPVVEHIENLTSRQGGDNEKLIFKVMKRGRDLEKALASPGEELADNGLRYDLTVPLARYFASNMESLPVPFKALQTGSVFRADNPQKGRFRQFTQCDIDILGDESSLAETELIAATADMLTKIFDEAGIKGFTVRVNDRRILSGAALQAGFKEEDIPSVLISLDKLDKIGPEGVKKELLQNGFEERCVDAYLDFYGQAGVSIEDFCKKIDARFLDGAIPASLEDIMDCTRSMVDESVSIVFDPTLVRGMGYYTGPIFEVIIDGYGFSIAGGGRYDHMIGKFSGQEVCACGFSIGFERIITILKDVGAAAKGDGDGAVAILVHKDADRAGRMGAFEKALALRKEGRTVTVLAMKKNLKSQVSKLETEGYTEFIKVYND